MEYVPLEKLIEQSGGAVYKLVVMASRRALEIAEGQPKLVDARPTLKPSTVALFEIRDGKVRYAGKK